MDKTDRSLLSHMQGDASLSVGELANRVGISKSACWRRIQKLETDGTIRKQVTLIDPAALGVPLTVFISVRTNQHNQSAFLLYMINIKERWKHYETFKDLKRRLKVK